MEKNRTAILGFYAVLSLVVIFTGLPNFSLQNIGYTLVTIALIVAYIARARWPRGDSFEENHSTYIIRTIWMYSFLFTIGAMVASWIVWQNGNRTALDELAESLVSGAQPTEETMDTAMKKYLSDNMDMMLRVSRVWVCPSQLYLVWRILQGGGRAFKNYRVANPKSWIK